MTNKETAVDKVRKLIALASSPYEEEARSSAFKAAALIREFQLEVVDPQQQHASRSDEGPRWIHIVSRYDGWCKTCNERYSAGDRVFWKRGTGCVHEDCGEP